MAARDASGDLILAPGTRDQGLESPRWLAGLRTGDALVYQVVMPDSVPQRLIFDVQRLDKRGRGVAALFVPRPSPDFPRRPLPYWLAGDEEALYRLDRHPHLLDPGFTPLDGSGMVVSEARNQANWQLPQGWSGPADDEGQPDPQAAGWVVEELSMKLEGPVRGDRCMQVSTLGAPVVRIAVCGDVGIVEVHYEQDMSMGERWELVEILRK